MRLLIACCLGVVFAASSALLLHLAVDAQEPPARLSITRVDTSEFPDQAVIVSVTDTTGHPVAGLQASDFLLQEEGTLVSDLEVQNVVDAGTPVLIVLAFDVSGSMDGEKLAAARQAASQLVAGLSEQDEVAVVTFADNVKVLLDPTPANAGSVQQVLDSLTASGNTALYDGAYQAVQVAAAGRAARRAVILLTDGEDFGNVSITAKEDVLRRAEDVASPIFTIGLGDDADRGILEELSALTRGEALFATSTDELDGLFDRIGQLLRNHYQIRYRSSVPADSGTYGLELAVTVAGEELRASATFASRPVEPEILVSALDALSSDGSAPSGTIEIVPDIEAQGDIVRVEFLIDGDSVHTTTESPFRYVLNTEALERGQHVFTIVATDAVGNVGSADYEFDLTGTAFNWGFAFLAIGIAAAVAVGSGFFFRMRRRQIVTAEQIAFTSQDQDDETPELEAPPMTEELAPDAPANAGGAQVVVSGDGFAERAVALSTGAVTIGRDPGCEVALPDDSRSVSREHARIVQEEGRYIIEDLGSTNGTIVNGERVDRAALEPGDEIEIGKYRLRLLAPDPNSPA